MVTIGACAVVFITFALVIYCEKTKYGYAETLTNDIVVDVSDTASEQASEQKLAQLTEHYQIPRRRTNSFIAKCKAVAQFAHVVFFMSADKEKELVRRNELTAQQLLEEYQEFINLPPEQRVDRFLKWRDDIAYFENHKHSPFSVKADVVEFKIH